MPTVLFPPKPLSQQEDQAATIEKLNELQLKHDQLLKDKIKILIELKKRETEFLLNKN